jgi:methyl-accepting chemotaxis protein
MFHIKSIQLKIILWVALAVFPAVIIIITFAIVSLRKTAIDAAKQGVVYEANSYAGAIKAKIEVALDNARTMAQALTAVKSSEGSITLSRDQANAMFRQLTTMNTDFVGTYTLWEPNAFDGLDAEFAGKAHYDQTGRFITYWNRNDQGQIMNETPLDYETEGPGEYYLCPKKTKQECVTEPYLYPVQGKEVLMTSIVAPIIVNGEFYGETGVDMSLDFLQTYVDAQNIYGGAGEIMLISYDGTLAAVKGQPNMVGKPGKELNSEMVSGGLLSRIQHGDTVVDYHGSELNVFVPVQFGNTTTPWSVNITVPDSKITATAMNLMWQMIGFAAGLFFVVVTLLWVGAGQIANPVKKLTEVAKAVSSGNLEAKAEVKSEDEVGVLVDVFNQTTTRIRQMFQNEQEQTKRLQSTVEKYSAFMLQVAQGDLKSRLSLDGDGYGLDDPLIVLGTRLNLMTDSLQTMINQIHDSSNALSSAAAEILSATTQQASGASEQSAAISQTTTTVDEVKAITEQASMRIQEVANASQRTVETARTGQRSVQETIDSMTMIKERVEGIAENILALSDQTQQIGDIIATVNEIAAQSNMLALNASVEAARAGEHGKGFAVVAMEVRSLAEQSRQATAQVKAILSEVQKATNSTVMATEEGTKGVERGVQLSTQAREAIEQLAAVINESAQVATQVVAGGRQQQTGVEQIAVAMQNINQATVQSLASTRQAERSAQNLNDLARKMNETVAQYNT